MDESKNNNIRGDQPNTSTENECHDCPEWAKKLEETLRGLEPLSAPKCRIYKVPDPLRKLNKEAYIPQVISVGPFHHGNEKLQSMENYKMRYLKSFMKRAKINMKKLASTIQDSEESVRECYAEAIPFDRGTFIKIILVDASFIIEFFLRKWSGNWTDDDFMVLKPWLTSRMQLDLILLENQLPFFIIKNLYMLALGSHSIYPPFLELTFNYFELHNLQEKRPDDRDLEIMHFVDLLRYFYLPPPQSLPERSTEVAKEMYCASQLAEAGLKFQLSSSKCSLDLKYNKGVLEIPSFTLDNATEIYARNLMALEQCHYPDDAYVTDYIFMLDFLIDTGRDVDLLVREGILVNGLGDNNAAFVNNLCTNISYSAMNLDYFSLCEDLKTFYKDPLHIMKATLKHDYFRTPWMGASTIAAVILLVLTLVQTACTVMPLL
ncbi:UPF0481 protein At3g47200-like [Juglans microcarpa x Juglans regia]|uniref:UPF0481 protein At3g47200-like n=1 Tax=Juglans microcarpa x Juglans regia TaxID=2249226 RepID=UPI001B7E412C|nr:UPF0481 protein At3g47200-like [Juglans microcarpa x Juglans regia]